MRKKLVSKIIEIRTNSLDAYVSDYFESHLSGKKDILMCFKKHKTFLKIEPCMWALIFALDGELFDELIIDEYSYYDVAKDLRFICGTQEFESCVSNESIVRIALSKEFKCIYQFLPHKILDALLFADIQNTDEIVSAFRRILETQKYLGKPVLKNFFGNSDKEMELLKAILKKSKELVLPPALVFYALHEPIGAYVCLEDHGYERDMIYSNIIKILKEKNIRSKYIKIPGLLVNTIRYWNSDMIKLVLNSCFTFDEILQAITAGEYFECYTNTLQSLISYVDYKYPEKLLKLEIALLGYINNDEFYIQYYSLFNLVSLERELRKFRYSGVFKESVIDFPVAYGLFKDFKKRKKDIKNGIKMVLEKYNVKFEYIINLIEPKIDDENEEEIKDFQSFKNLFK